MHNTGREDVGFVSQVIKTLGFFLGGGEGWCLAEFYLSEEYKPLEDRDGACPSIAKVINIKLPAGEEEWT